LKSVHEAPHETDFGKTFETMQWFNDLQLNRASFGVKLANILTSNAIRSGKRWLKKLLLDSNSPPTVTFRCHL